MAYRYPPFAKIISISQQDGKRYSLEVSLEAQGKGSLVVIQKNPSRANDQVSDHTINRVLNYVQGNRNRYSALEEVGCVVFLNLIPWYETYSRKLVRKQDRLADPVNMETISQYLANSGPCIIAWGNPPAGLQDPYIELCTEVMIILKKYGNPVFHVGALTRLNQPRHGQIWGYEDKLSPYTLR